jgi:glycosyltransferase involved in cell wall biosynthesis
MKVCVISLGVVHATPRTIAFGRHFDDVHFIDMVGVADQGKLESEGIKYYRLDQQKHSRIPFLNLQKLLQTIGPDMIVCHFCSGPHFFGAISYNRCPVAVIAMGQDVLYDRGDTHVGLLRRLLVRMSLRRTTYISAKSKFLIERIRSYGATCPTDLNYWGADLNHFKPGDREAARAQLGFPEKGYVLLSPRAIEPRLNIHLIVEALAKIRVTYPDILLVVIGRSNPAYLAKVKDIISKHELTSNILIGGDIDQDDLPHYYAAADLVISMGRSEGFPNTVLEVMCCRRPIVVGRIPQIEEILRDDRDCRMVDINSGDIASGILDLIQQPTQAAKFADEGYRKALEVADIARNGENFALALEQHLPGYRPLSLFSLITYRFVFLLYMLQRRIFGG